MLLGEIKIEALKIMFANYENDLLIENLSNLADDENYSNYIYNMPGAINRCFSDLEERRILPLKRFLLSPAKAEKGVFFRFDLESLINDFFDIDRIVYENENGEYQEDVEYRREGNILVLPRVNEGESYTVLYYPKIERVSDTTSDALDLSIPNHIASYIPYFIKGELYRNDEPNEAGEARNWYEAGIEQIANNTNLKGNKTKRVNTIYSQTEI